MAFVEVDMFAWGVSLRLESNSAELFTRTIDTEISPLVEGTPQVQTYQVSNSTFHKIAVPVAA
jgi:hypothetical protein